MRRSVRDLSGDSRGLAAVEFAMIVPLMLVLFFGTVEFSSGVAVDRKVTMMARTLSDLTSQNISVTDTAADQLLQRQHRHHDALFGDPDEVHDHRTLCRSHDQGCAGAMEQGIDAPRGAGTTVAIPTALQVGGTYLIYSEVSYIYMPASAS